MAHQIDIIAGTNDLQFSDNPENDEYQQSMRKDSESIFVFQLTLL